MIYEKPKNEIFASDAKDGEIVEFPNVKRGWGVTENLGFIPPMEYFNAAFNRVDKSLAYQLQRGVGEWDKDMEYPIGAVVSLNGIIYIAKSQNTNKNPANEATIWSVFATQEWSDATFLKKTDKIDAYTKAESDDKFVAKTDKATETKAGITKLKNSITAQQEDAAVTEKAVSDFVAASQSGLGIGQTWQDVKDQRQAGVTYTNTTGRPIMVCIEATMNYGTATCPIFVDGIKVGEVWEHHAVNKVDNITFIVPNGSTYKADLTIGINTISIWSELR
ncbi:hypothetical protein CCON61_08310 [Campylobacter concisus]|uniref:hypothetical protein n=1 Tax=Campylobacter concisus TaxID=199 RepID=UPI000A1FBB20|nr:hypothetical protein [Campylobacter concisus]OSQ23558.1 hypothetical protein CCON61_08310 [Campylobacter concisus]